MANEEMQSTMQFLLEQQAQFNARLQKDEERMRKDEERIARVENAIVILTELARRADERMDTFDAGFSTFNEKMARLSEVHTETGQRLDALIIMVERYLSNRNGASQA